MDANRENLRVINVYFETEKTQPFNVLAAKIAPWETTHGCLFGQPAELTAFAERIVAMCERHLLYKKPYNNDADIYAEENIPKQFGDKKSVQRLVKKITGTFGKIKDWITSHNPGRSYYYTLKITPDKEGNFEKADVTLDDMDNHESKVFFLHKNWEYQIDIHPERRYTKEVPFMDLGVSYLYPKSINIQFRSKSNNRWDRPTEAAIFYHPDGEEGRQFGAVFHGTHWGFAPNQFFEKMHIDNPVHFSYLLRCLATQAWQHASFPRSNLHFLENTWWPQRDETRQHEVAFGDEIIIGDPCYTKEDGPECLRKFPSVKGLWRVIINIASDNKHPQKVRLYCPGPADENTKCDRHVGFFGVDSGQLGVYDAKICEDIIGTKEEFYPVVCTVTCEQEFCNYASRAFISNTHHGDGTFLVQGAWQTDSDGVDRLVAIEMNLG